MRKLGAIVGVLSRIVNNARQNRSLRCTIAFQFVGDLPERFFALARRRARRRAQVEIPRDPHGEQRLFTRVVSTRSHARFAGRNPFEAQGNRAGQLDDVGRSGFTAAHAVDNNFSAHLSWQ